MNFASPFISRTIATRIVTCLYENERKNSVTQLRKEIDATSCAVSIALKKLVSIKIIEKKSLNGRTNFFVLTEKGKEIAKRLCEILKKMEL